MPESRRIAVRGLIYKDGKLFVQKLHSSKQDYWCTPGGGIDPLESLHDALIREMIEETGVMPVVGKLALIQQFATHGTSSHGEDEQLEFFFMIENPEDYERIDLSATTHGEDEIAAYGFVDPLSENVLPKILQGPTFYETLKLSDAVQIFTQM